MGRSRVGLTCGEFKAGQGSGTQKFVQVSFLGYRFQSARVIDVCRILTGIGSISVQIMWVYNRTDSQDQIRAAPENL